MFLCADNEKTYEILVNVDSYDDYAEQMKAYRKKHHITQKELAELMGVKHFTLRGWEQKHARPPYHVWRYFKQLFNDSVLFP